MHELELAEWRRLMARLYADVRGVSLASPAAAHELWRSVREQLYREHPQSPVPAADRAAFRARHFPYDPALRFTCTLNLPTSAGATTTAAEAAGAATADPTPASGSEARARAALEIPNSGLAFRAGPTFEVAGSVDVPFAAGRRTLAIFWLDEYSGGLFLPFGDLTNGRSTYAAGRYLLDTAKGADLGGDVAAGTLVLDFNFAYQPSCAFDARWACPLAPPSNRLDIEIAAGERLA